MSRVTESLIALCFGIASASAVAQAVAPPAGGSPGKGSTAVAPANPTANAKDTKPMSDHPAVTKGGTGTTSGNATPEPTGKDAMATDNKPKHPAATDGAKGAAPK